MSTGSKENIHGVYIIIRASKCPWLGVWACMAVIDFDGSRSLQVGWV